METCTELTQKMILAAFEDDTPHNPTLFYGGVSGIPLELFPLGVEDGEVFGSFRHVKVKRL